MTTRTWLQRLRWARFPLISVFVLGLLAGAVRAAPRQDWPLYPDPVLTPGDFFPDVTVADACTPRYATVARSVTKSERNAVFAAYGDPQDASLYTLDHFIPLSLGGSNSVLNLWPEPVAVPGSHEKDKVEDYLHAAVCSGAISLADAREVIRDDWYAVYLQITGN
jgi:hypothetical protein